MTDIVERLRHCSENCGDEYLHELTCRAADEITRLTAEVSELNSMFDAQWNADMAGVQMWREAHPGNDMVLPDRKRFTAWILAEIVVQRAENERLRAALNPFADESLWSGPDHEFVTVRRSDCDRARAAITQETRDAES